MSTVTMSMPSTRRFGEPTTSTDRPTLICCKTIIGKGSPNRAGTDLAHGQALGEKEVALTREALGWTFPPFEIPQSIYDEWNARGRRRGAGARLERPLRRVQRGAPGTRRRIRAAHREANCRAPSTNALARFVQQQNEKAETVATRKASQQAIEALAPMLPELIGGSADLTGSVFTNWSGSKAGRRAEQQAITSISACASSR